MKFDYIKIIILHLIFNTHLIGTENQTPKVLVLIIASDNIPGDDFDYPYKQLQEVWRTYMKLDPEHVEAYFIRGNPDLIDQFYLENDTLWSKTEESLSPGILNKTILSMEYFSNRLDEFDFVLRTNLSSFFVIPKLLNILRNLPKTRTYCASGELFGSGCGYILSPDIVWMILRNKCRLYNMTGHDDVVLGDFLRQESVPLLPASRIDILNLNDWVKYKQQDRSDYFHFRVKNNVREHRVTNDLYIYSELLKKYYGINKLFN